MFYLIVGIESSRGDCGVRSRTIAADDFSLLDLSLALRYLGLDNDNGNILILERVREKNFVTNL